MTGDMGETMAIQLPEELFERLKAYFSRKQPQTEAVHHRTDEDAGAGRGRHCRAVEEEEPDELIQMPKKNNTQRRRRMLLRRRFFVHGGDRIYIYPDNLNAKATPGSAATGLGRHRH